MRLIHRLILLIHGIAPDFVLNEGPAPADGGAPLPAAADLHRTVNALKAEAFDLARGRVDYARLSRSPTYAEYAACARRLQAFDPASLAHRQERLAFWINLYNALMVDAVIQFGVKRSVNEVPGFFWRAAYRLGGQRYNAFDIEYGLLRANAGHPAIPGPHFGPGDPRRAHSLAQLDPRLHFALVCAARSCPPIAVYDSDQIDDQLDLAARSFVNNGGVVVERAAGRVRLSQIFQWYAPDFGGAPLGLGSKRPLLQFAARYLADASDREFVLRGEPAVQFQNYDWSLNAVAAA